MFARFFTHRERDINSTSLGKQRTYCLKRGDTHIRFTGKLLSFYHAADDCLEPAAQNQTHLETIALFRTQSQYLIYYVLLYQNNEHLSGRHVHLHATPDLDGAERFIGAMAYVNKRAFATAVVEDARAMDAGKV
ncbi:hypothetical protein [Fundidesulfovibrio agrisoli]|uniref:hypothetical protein n=1 Tax=Fundidesulfovibrio agrisoli TaxID=2922717 RepID=UPI001FAB8CCA|nr:hypothetical protein [Fundidesulfovibrio agrisoli]